MLMTYVRESGVLFLFRSAATGFRVNVRSKISARRYIFNVHNYNAYNVHNYNVYNVHNYNAYNVHN